MFILRGLQVQLLGAAAASAVLLYVYQQWRRALEEKVAQDKNYPPMVNQGLFENVRVSSSFSARWLATP